MIAVDFLIVFVKKNGSPCDFRCGHDTAIDVLMSGRGCLRLLCDYLGTSIFELIIFIVYHSI